jgi:predicted dithiol-disulfide oxidoreductase (DUF899 family)
MTATEPTVAHPTIVSRAEWDAARADLLAQEKALTRHKDQVSAARRRLPMVEITTPYIFDSETGPQSLLDLFDGRSQLIIQHFMFHPDWDEGCSGCSMMADHIGPVSHLHARDTSYVLVSRAPLEKLLGFRQRMGWSLPWVSSANTTFNHDFRTTVDDQEDHAISAFLRDGDRIFLTWDTHNRGTETFGLVFDLLDTTAWGRQETWEDSPAGWPQTPPYEWIRLHDRYEQSPAADGCCH